MSLGSETSKTEEALLKTEQRSQVGPGLQGTYPAISAALRIDDRHLLGNLEPLDQGRADMQAALAYPTILEEEAVIPSAHPFHRLRCLSGHPFAFAQCSRAGIRACLGSTVCNGLLVPQFRRGIVSDFGRKTLTLCQGGLVAYPNQVFLSRYVRMNLLLAVGFVACICRWPHEMNHRINVTVMTNAAVLPACVVGQGTGWLARLREARSTRIINCPFFSFLLFLLLFWPCQRSG